MMNEQQKEKFFVFNDSVLFDFVLLVFFLFIAIGSFEYNLRARAIPAGLGILGSAMMLLQFLSNAFPRIGTKLKFVSQSGLLGDASGPVPKNTKPAQEVETKIPSDYNWWQAFRLVLWLAGFILLLSLSNYLVAVGIFILLITKIEAQESWKRAVILALSVNICFFILFNLILDVHLD